MVEYFFDRVQNSVENAGNQHFSTMFSKGFCLGVVKSQDWVVMD